MITGSTWDTVAKSLYDRMRTARPQGHSGDTFGTLAPTLTNREAVSLLNEWRRAAGPLRFPLWYALAAPAYGWHEQGDELSPYHAEDYYPADDAAIMWPWLLKLAPLLDGEKVPTPRIAPDTDTYSDPIFTAELRAQLEHDGSNLDDMEAHFKIPVGCKKDDIKIDPKTKLPYCDKPVMTDDPITAIVKTILSQPPVLLAALILVGWAVYNNDKDN